MTISKAFFHEEENIGVRVVLYLLLSLEDKFATKVGRKKEKKDHVVVDVHVNCVPENFGSI